MNYTGCFNRMGCKLQPIFFACTCCMRLYVLYALCTCLCALVRACVLLYALVRAVCACMRLYVLYALVCACTCCMRFVRACMCLYGAHYSTLHTLYNITDIMDLASVPTPGGSLSIL